ncbi:hypothetical protein PINS_up012900 [Pythium insidiosum]|nr:hypothetical protein PINS_up012900 [Pythium insidiosum]
MADEEDALTATAQGHDTGAELHVDPEADARAAWALASFSVAEDLCSTWVRAFVDDLTSQVQVREDNERCLRVVRQAAWRQVVDGCTLLRTAWPESTLDDAVSLRVSRESTVIVEEDDDGQDDDQETTVALVPSTSSGDDGRRMQQVLRIHVEDDVNEGGQQPVATVSPFLDALWRVISTQREWVERRLTLFRSSRFRSSAVPSVGRPGEWELPPEDLPAFLRDVVVASGISVLSESVSDAVMQRNAALLSKKRHTRSRLQLQHVELCVQNALLVSETTPHNAHAATATAPDVPFFATELAPSENKSHASTSSAAALLLVGLHAGADAPLIDIDRSATGVVTHKALASATVAKQQSVVRDIVRMLKRNSFKSSKWDELRRRVLTTPDQQHVAIAVEASLTLAPAPAPTPPTRRQSSSSSNVSGRKKSAVVASVSASASAATASTKKPPPLVVVEPDAATLSNIFSLGTPRQLTAEELARRNDILAVLEREEQRATRKLAVASFTALTGIPPPSTVMDDSDKVWREYTAAVSSVTLTGEGCGVPTAGESADKKIGKRTSEKTKFDLALEAPAFDVADGNTPARRAMMMELASLSPVKRGRHRGTTQTMVRGTSPGPSPSPSPSPSVPVSPVATAATTALTTPGNGHLPQLDTSRLAVGVKAVVRGVEKRGPRPSPSRNSRLRLHNYHVRLERRCGCSGRRTHSLFCRLHKHTNTVLLLRWRRHRPRRPSLLPCSRHLPRTMRRARAICRPCRRSRRVRTASTWRL